jgi:hypothetical protein
VSTRIKAIELFWWNRDIFNDIQATQHFVSTLQHKISSVQKLPLTSPYHFPKDSRDAIYASIKCSLIRNHQVNRVALLLVPPPPTPHLQQQQQQHATGMMLKISHKAITKFATVGSNNAGTSAIFKLFQARPALLEKRIKRPSPAAAAATPSTTGGSYAPQQQNQQTAPPLDPH